MAGKLIEEARTAQRAASGKPQSRNNRNATTQSANVSQSIPPISAEPSKSNNTVMFNGKSYMLVSDTNVATAQANDNTALTAVSTADYDHISLADYDQEEYFAMLATTDDAQASVNWDTYTEPRKPLCEDSAAYSTRNIAHAAELPFILDTGATCHISPKATDFKTLRRIPRHPVKGLAGSAVYAVGIGDIELHIASGHKLKLNNVLYIPDSSVRLISILALNKSGDYTTHFDSTSCWVTNKSNTVLVRGSISSTKRLYVLSTKIPSVQHKKPPDAPTALYARVPDLETWHRRLSHCNTRTIMEMAKNGVLEGMPIDLSSLPPKCDHCTLGKQSRSPVPKTQEGSKAEKRLKRVFVDLCGPMAVSSRTRNAYS